MDVRRFELGGSVRARVADAAGEREVVLEGEAGTRVRRAAEPLLAHTGASSLTFEPPALLLLDGRPGDARGLERLLQPVARAILLEQLTGERPPAGATLDAGFWSAAYQAGQDGWELGRAAPPLARWASGEALRDVRALVLGAGRGHEARLLADAGARVTAVDYAAEAIAEARRLHGEAIDFRRLDLFSLPAGGERWPLVVEHCCFCAIDPARRDEYVDVVADLLEPGGRLVGLYWAHARPGGPPFAVSREELEARLGRRLRIEEVEVPADSVAGRLGQELLVTARAT